MAAASFAARLKFIDLFYLPDVGIVAKWTIQTIAYDLTGQEISVSEPAVHHQIYKAGEEAIPAFQAFFNEEWNGGEHKVDLRS